MDDDAYANARPTDGRDDGDELWPVLLPLETVRAYAFTPDGDPVVRLACAKALAARRRTVVAAASHQPDTTHDNQPGRGPDDR